MIYKFRHHGKFHWLALSALFIGRTVFIQGQSFQACVPFGYVVSPFCLPPHIVPDRTV